MLSCGASFVQFTIFTVNFIFLILGAVLVIAGTVIQFMYKDVVELVPNEVFSLPMIAISTGLVIFTLAFFAHCGASRKNVCMLHMFAFLLALLFVVEILTGFAMVLFHGQIEASVEGKMKDSMAVYESEVNDGRHGAATIAWDAIQSDLHCCGVNSYKDWDSYIQEFGKYPKSCMASEGEIYADGCIGRLMEMIQSQFVVLVGIGITIGVVQTLAFIFAVLLICAIKREKKTPDLEPLLHT